MPVMDFTPDFTPLSKMGEIWEKAQQKRALQEAYAQPGALDYEVMARRVGAAGDPAAAMNLLQMKLRLDEAKRQETQFGQTHGLSQQQLAESIKQHAAQQDLANRQLAEQQRIHSPGYITESKTAEMNVTQPTVNVKRPGPFGSTQEETLLRGPGGTLAPIPRPAGTTSKVGDDVTGDEYLNSLPFEERTLIKKVANYEINPASLSTRDGHRERVMAAASRYDPNYDQAMAPARFAAIKEFNAGGQTSPAAAITAGNTAIQHLAGLSDAAEKLKNRSIPFWNTIANKALEATGDPRVTEFNSYRNRFVEEATKFYRGAGGAEADIQRDIKALNDAQSPEQLRAAIAAQADLMASKINALQDRWKQATGRGPEKLIKDFPIVQGKSMEALDKVMERAGKPRYSTPADPGGGAGASVGGPAATMALTEARAAIASGKISREEVIKRLTKAGIDPSGL